MANREQSLVHKNHNAKRTLNRFSLLFIIVALVIVFTFASTSFLSIGNISNILIVQVTVGCMAMGALLILVIGEFDLSLGYMIGFCIMVGAVLSKNGSPPALTIIAMIGAGALAGLGSAILTVRFKVSSFISTLAVGIVLNGITLGLSNGEVLSSNIPEILLTLGQGKTLGLGNCVWLWIILSIFMFFLLEYTTFGRSLYAIGGSQKVSFMAGVKTDRVKTVVFVLSGMFTGIASIVQLGQSGAAYPSFGPSLLMPAYAAAFLSVTAYKPGNYNIIGLVLAIIIIGIGVNGLSLVGAPFWAENVFNGLVLIVAVLTAAKEARSVRVG